MADLITMSAAALADLMKVGPHGYIHGWIKVGAGDEGNDELHGHIAAAAEAHESGRHGEGDAHLAAARAVAKDPATRESIDSARGGLAADRMNFAWSAKDRKAQAAALSDAELKTADKEFTRRAAMLGKPGQVSRPHQSVKDELGRRAGGGKTPMPKPTKPTKPTPKKAEPDLSTREGRAKALEGVDISTPAGRALVRRVQRASEKDVRISYGP